MKRTKRVDAARSKVAPVAENLAHHAADKLGPLAKDAYAKAGPLAKDAYAKAGPLAQDAYAKAAPYAAAAAAAAVPLAHSAAEKVGPLAQSAKDAVSPYAHAAADAVTPYVQAAADKVSPYTDRAVEAISPLAASGAHVAHEAADRIRPAVEDAIERVTPAAEAARDKVTDDLVPKLTAALGAAAASPLAVEAAKRGRATVAAARGELELPAPPKKGRWLKRLAVVAAVAGIATVVVRKLTAQPAASPWQSARPSTPAPTPPAPAAVPEPATTDAAAGDDPQAGTSQHAETLLADGQAQPDQPTEGGEVVEESPVAADPAPPAEDSAAPVEEAPVADEAPAAEAPAAEAERPVYDIGYGEGSWVGAEPPEGYPVKGNENSKKYHVPGSANYDRTIAEVWFSTPEVAEAAGFVRARS